MQPPEPIPPPPDPRLTVWPQVDPRCTYRLQYAGQCGGCHCTHSRMSLTEAGEHFCSDPCMVKRRRQRRESRVFWGRLCNRVADFIDYLWWLHTWQRTE